MDPVKEDHENEINYVMRPSLYTRKQSVGIKRGLKRREHRRERNKLPSELTITFTSILSPIHRSTAIKTVLEYLLFHRFQVSQPFILLRRQYGVNLDHQARNNVGLPATEDRMRQKYDRASSSALAFMDNISHSLDIFFLHHKVARTLLILGSTVVSPKETFGITVEQDASSDSVTTMSDRKGIERTARHVGRELVMNSALQDWNDRISPTKAFVLVYASSPCSQQVPPFFVVKHSFQPRNSGKQFNINILESSVTVNLQESDHFPGDDSCLEGQAHPFLWYQSQIPLHGFH